jgi:hypothetical protein
MQTSRLIKLAAGIALTGAGITYFGVRSSIDMPDLTYSSNRILSGRGLIKDYLDVGAILIPFLGVTGLALQDTYRTHQEQDKATFLRRKRGKKPNIY